MKWRKRNCKVQKTYMTHIYSKSPLCRKLHRVILEMLRSQAEGNSKEVEIAKRLGTKSGGKYWTCVVGARSIMTEKNLLSRFTLRISSDWSLGMLKTPFAVCLRATGLRCIDRRESFVICQASTDIQDIKLDLLENHCIAVGWSNVNALRREVGYFLSNS